MAENFFRLIFFLFFLFVFFRLMATEGLGGKQMVQKSLYVFGDSLADVGNNDYLITLIRADFSHNGIDFNGGKPTGRFSNGKNAVDFLAEKIGLPSPPPYLAIASRSNNYEAFINGVNFASGGAGILDSTHKGECLSFNKQIDYLSAVYASIVRNIGAAQAVSHLSNSIFIIIIGSDDILLYLSNQKVTPQQFVASLISTLQLQLQRIYDLGARKIVFVGTAALGCCPALRIQSNNGDCNALATYVSDLYNDAAASLLKKMKSLLGDMNYSFLDTCLALLELIQNPYDYGFTDVKDACCGLGSLNAKFPCSPISYVCPNRKNHIFWDLYHPTETADEIIAADAVDGKPPLVYPLNVRQLSAL